LFTLQVFELCYDKIQCFIPTGALEATVTFDKRIQQTIGVMNLEIGSYTFRTKPPLIDGKVIARLNPDHMILLNQEVHAALHGTIRTMGRHDLVNDTIRAPATMRRVMQVWPISLDDLIQMFYSAHEVPDVFREPLNTLSST
jgi:hypothetical protein